MRRPKAMERSAETTAHNPITPRQYLFVVVWAVCGLLIYGIGGYLGATFLRADAKEDARIRQSWIESWLADRGGLQPSDSIPSQTTPVDVEIGLSLDRVEEIALRESAWTADFILSLRWTGETEHRVDDFRIANDQIL